ncbi:putative transcriptional regulatory protein-like protein [Hapsidospora chrysogenum ATCC 11550]|uniref:Putative transcriptional regulatory protein-like protein n=1 Tax=Hapsidospora chrysogenum (strain ATCC 11550 / CBS 779.69 / DSM 880 / IAM 14645 / JCM 23072 / IMI 49137) TaxID=857340 RepID=A0A086SXV5_HAPC1|nr:putative transcriptional regulatory protein-like protein [Hapsidospora chrysogenum ATCC 11550]
MLLSNIQKHCPAKGLFQVRILRTLLVVSALQSPPSFLTCASSASNLISSDNVVGTYIGAAPLSQLVHRPHPQVIGELSGQKVMAQLKISRDGGANTQRAMLGATAQDLQHLLSDGSLTSEELVDISLRQIEAFDQQGPLLRAMIKVAPREKLLGRARALDAERQQGEDIINTDPFWELPTTQGAKVLEHAQNAGQSKLVDQNPGGSSTGSALAVAAGYSPISIGGEADGSLTTPASRAALYALKCTPQTISTEGIFQIVPTFEAVGGMAKSVKDLADITNVILQAAKEPRSLEVQLQNDWQGIRLGFVDPPKFKLPDFLFDSDEEYLARVKGAIEKAIDVIKQGGGTVHYPINLTHPFDVHFKDGPGYLKVLSAEVRDSINANLAELTDTPVRTLKDIIDWNEKHPEHQAGIDQTYFIAAQNDETTPEELAEARAFVKQTSGADGIFKVMDDLEIDAICAPTDGPICTLAAMAGCPTAFLPLFDEEDFLTKFQLKYSTATPEDACWWACLNVVLSIAHRLRAISASDAVREDKFACGYIQNAMDVVPELNVRSLSAVQALVGMACVLQGTPNPEPASMLVAAALRLAQAMNLHRESSNLSFTAEEAEKRRRVFWKVYILDKDVSLRTSQPFSQDDDDMDVRLPSNSTFEPSNVDLFNRRIGLALVQGQVYKQLYSVRAERQTAAQSAIAAQQLSAVLSYWKSSAQFEVSEHSKIVTGHRISGEMTHRVVMRLTYIHCLTMIDRHLPSMPQVASSHEISRSEPPITPGSVCLAESRQAIHLIEAIPHTNCVWYDP